MPNILDIKRRRDELADRCSTLAKQYREGDITKKAYNDGLVEIGPQLDQLEDDERAYNAALKCSGSVRLQGDRQRAAARVRLQDNGRTGNQDDG
jgi:hypothetical protein